MRVLNLFLVVIISGCATQPHEAYRQVEKVELKQPEQLMKEGYQTLANRNTKQAIEKYFNKAIDLCNEKYNNKEKKVYASRSSTDALFYMMKATSEKQDAITVDSTCAEVLYLKGYASLDLGNVEKAVEYINKAIIMSPVNSKYLSELGHIYQQERDFDRANEYFKKAEENAKLYSPAEVKIQELSRAKRGIAYTYIELGKLDDAEVIYRDCLKLDSNDKAALNELKYIEKIRNYERKISTSVFEKTGN